MFDSLIDFEPEPGDPSAFVPATKAPVQDILEAQVATSDWLSELGATKGEEVDEEVERQSARDAFNALNFNKDDDAQRVALASIKTPAAVQHLTGMLTAYDWDFIHQAKELRGYAVAKIMEETKHPDARIRLKALQMLGNVTEVALFTERVEVTKKDASEEEIERRLRQRLEKFLSPEKVVDIKAALVPHETQSETAPDVSDKALDEEIGQVADSRHA